MVNCGKNPRAYIHSKDFFLGLYAGKLVCRELIFRESFASAKARPYERNRFILQYSKKRRNFMPLCLIWVYSGSLLMEEIFT